MGVRAVMRRASAEPRSTRQRPLAALTSMTDTPWAAWDFATFSRVHGSIPPTCRSPSSVYSWFMTRRPRVELSEPGGSEK